MMVGMAVDDQPQAAILGRALRSGTPIPVDGADDEALGDLIGAGLLVRHGATVTATTAATTFYELAREFPGLLPT
jgi:hypothetical protein